jgi:hypothetical protein
MEDILEHGAWVITPDGEGRIVAVYTHPTAPTCYVVMIQGSEYRYHREQLKPAE